jgi:hypothetical protein
VGEERAVGYNVTDDQDYITVILQLCAYMRGVRSLQAYTSRNANTAITVSFRFVGICTEENNHAGTATRVHSSTESTAATALQRAIWSSRLVHSNLQTTGHPDSSRRC